MSGHLAFLTVELKKGKAELDHFVASHTKEILDAFTKCEKRQCVGCEKNYDFIGVFVPCEEDQKKWKPVAHGKHYVIVYLVCESCEHYHNIEIAVKLMLLADEEMRLERSYPIKPGDIN